MIRLVSELLGCSPRSYVRTTVMDAHHRLPQRVAKQFPATSRCRAQVCHISDDNDREQDRDFIISEFLYHISSII